jgi:hypothetical protein
MDPKNLGRSNENLISPNQSLNLSPHYNDIPPPPINTPLPNSLPVGAPNAETQDSTPQAPNIQAPASQPPNMEVAEPPNAPPPNMEVVEPPNAPPPNAPPPNMEVAQSPRRNSEYANIDENENKNRLSRRQKTSKELALNKARKTAKRNLIDRFGKAKPQDVFRLVSYRKQGLTDEQAFAKLGRPSSRGKNKTVNNHILNNKTRRFNSMNNLHMRNKLRQLSDQFVENILNAVMSAKE